MRQKRREFLTLTSVLLSQMTFLGSYASVFKSSEYPGKFSKAGFAKKAINPLFIEDFHVVSKGLTDLAFKGDLKNALVSEDFCLIPFSQNFQKQIINTSYLIFKNESGWKFVTQFSDLELKTLLEFFENNNSQQKYISDFLPIKKGIFNNIPGFKSKAGIYHFSTKIDTESAKVQLSFESIDSGTNSLEKTFKIN